MHKQTFLLIATLSSTAFAQPAPAPEAKQPAEAAPPVVAQAPAPAPAPTPTTATTDPQPQPPTEQQPAPAPTPEPTPAPQPAPATQTGGTVTAAAEPPPKKLSVGSKGLFNPGILAQAWFQNERAGDETQVSQFRLRRAEISAMGQIVPDRMAYKVMFDPAKVRETQKVTVAGPPDAMGNPTTVTVNNPSSAVSVLQDFYITALSSYVDVSIGQFKIPVSWEGYNSSGKLIFPERAVVSNTFGDKRDLGVRFEKKFKQVGYSAGIFNGSGLDNFDNNVQKDVALRLEAYPVEGLTIAGVTYDSVAERNRAGTKDRWEGDVRYESGPYLVQAEAIFAKDVAKDNVDATPGRGFYALAGYTLKDIDSQFHGDLQPVVRIGAFDPDTNADDNALMHYDIGLNYYVLKNEMKAQLAYQRTQFQDPMKSANNELILAAQVMY